MATRAWLPALLVPLFLTVAQADPSPPPPVSTEPKADWSAPPVSAEPKADPSPPPPVSTEPKADPSPPPASTEPKPGLVPLALEDARLPQRVGVAGSTVQCTTPCTLYVTPGRVSLTISGDGTDTDVGKPQVRTFDVPPGGSNERIGSWLEYHTFVILFPIGMVATCVGPGMLLAAEISSPTNTTLRDVALVTTGVGLASLITSIWFLFHTSPPSTGDEDEHVRHHPHHIRSSRAQPPVLIGATPTLDGGGVAWVSGRF